MDISFLFFFLKVTNTIVLLCSVSLVALWFKCDIMLMWLSWQLTWFVTFALLAVLGLVHPRTIKTVLPAFLSFFIFYLDLVHIHRLCTRLSPLFCTSSNIKLVWGWEREYFLLSNLKEWAQTPEHTWLWWVEVKKTRHYQQDFTISPPPNVDVCTIWPRISAGNTAVVVGKLC